MKASTYKAFKKLNKRIDDLTAAVAQLVAQGDRDATAGRMAGDLNKAAGALNAADGAIPATAGQPTP